MRGAVGSKDAERWRQNGRHLSGEEFALFLWKCLQVHVVLVLGVVVVDRGVAVLRRFLSGCAGFESFSLAVVIGRRGFTSE